MFLVAAALSALADIIFQRLIFSKYQLLTDSLFIALSEINKLQEQTKLNASSPPLLMHLQQIYAGVILCLQPRSSPGTWDVEMGHRKRLRKGFSLSCPPHCLSFTIDTSSTPLWTPLWI